MWGILVTTAILVALSWFVLGVQSKNLDRREDG